MSARRMLVVGAHSADFVWRSAGTVAAHTAAGGEALVVALSYGERGESGALWKQEGQTEENVKRIRHEEATKAASAVGASFRAFDLGDYPLDVPHGTIGELAELMRDFAPHVVLTHPEKDPFNPDHPSPTRPWPAPGCSPPAPASPAASVRHRPRSSWPSSRTSPNCAVSHRRSMWTSRPSSNVRSTP